MNGTRTRQTILVLAAMLLTSAAALFAIENLGPRGEPVDGVAPHSVLALELVNDAASFERALRAYWIAPRPASALTEAGTPEAPITRLRWSLVVDSLLLVPAYGGLLVVSMLVFYRRLRAPRPGRIEPLLHALCALPVLATVFDIAENGMLVRAAEDALAGLLADPTVADVRDASDIKWGWIAAASVMSGWMALLVTWRVRGERPRHAWTLPAAAALALAAALLLCPGTPWPRPLFVQIGALCFGALLLLQARNAWVLAADASVEAQAPLG